MAKFRIFLVAVVNRDQSTLHIMEKKMEIGERHGVQFEGQ